MNGYNTPVRDGWEIYISILFSSFIGQSLFIYLRVSIFFLNRGFSFNFYFCAVCDRATASVPKRLFYFIFLIEWRNNNVPKEGRNLLYQSGTWFIDQIASKFLFSLLYVKSLKEKKNRISLLLDAEAPTTPTSFFLGIASTIDAAAAVYSISFLGRIWKANSSTITRLSPQKKKRNLQYQI